jgi:NADP-dependent 3-hydroxy acid dehydrogenase YdfG
MPGIEESRCILVTGATSGIGRALALNLARLPSKPRVVAAGRRQNKLDELRKEGLETVPLDLDTDALTLKKSVDFILDKYPQA